MKIAVLTGAGVSAESGLGTYRDNGGLWDNYDPMEVASIEGWYRNRKLVLDFYNMQRRKLKDAKPNDAHLGIARLEQTSEVTVITQNVDNLHEKAGSSHIIHLHGEATKVRPERGAYDDSYSEREVTDVGYNEVNLGDLSEKGIQLRPHIVFFGEAVPKLEDAIAVVREADILLIVGTSMQVYPAASLYRYAKPGTPIYVVDPSDIPVSGHGIVHIKEKATRGVKTFIEKYLDLPR